MRQPPSIFNDVIGPVMTGPSSSHTAGPCRMGLMGNQLYQGKLQSIEVYFDRKGSFAASYNLQGTDRGLIGGILGIPPEDIRLHTALQEARRQGVRVNFLIDNFEADHPNTAKVALHTDLGEVIRYTGKSTGGGIFQITELNGFPVELFGDYYELIVICEPECESAVRQMIADISIQELSRAETGGKMLVNVKLAQPVEDALIQRITALDSVHWVRQLAPVLPVLSRADCAVPFRTGVEMMRWTEQTGAEYWEAASYYESQRGNISQDEVFKKMLSIADVMEQSVYEGLHNPRPGQIIRARASNYLAQAGNGHLIPSGAMDTAIAWTMAVVEVNSRYGLLVAAPTAGSCGVLPGAILGTAEYMGLSKEDKVKALFAAGGVGMLIAEHATFSSELCGCQAECGAGSAMAAAGVVQLAGGSPGQCAAAASLALQNVLGMICDSVADLVETPCLGRNVLGTVNAIACANMALAGVEEIIPLDETIQAMYAVGKMMPSELCCTGKGGLAITETSQRIKRELGL